MPSADAADVEERFPTFTWTSRLKAVYAWVMTLNDAPHPEVELFEEWSII